MSFFQKKFKSVTWQISNLHEKFDRHHPHHFPWFKIKFKRDTFENYKTFVSVEVQNPTMYSIILMEILQIWKLPLLKHNFLKVHSPSLNLNVMPFWDKYHRTCVFTDVTSIRSKLCATFIALLPYDLMLLLLNTTGRSESPPYIKLGGGAGA